MKRAVFLDRDGVIAKLVRNPATGEEGPAHSLEDLVIEDGAIPALRELQQGDYELFLVSNQPDYAKGKATLAQLNAVQDAFDRILKKSGIHLRHSYYCFHHPDGTVPAYSVACECRKPRPGSILAAARDYGIDLPNSWMIGDRDTDIECGRAAGTRTIRINNPKSASYRSSSAPDFESENLKEAVQLILHKI